MHFVLIIAGLVMTLMIYSQNRCGGWIFAERVYLAAENLGDFALFMA